jgi:transcriptional regulator with XRE-family HTH domain
MNEQNLGQKIRMFRQRAKMAQLDLELEIDAAPGSISRIESGKVNPGKETLLKIIKALNIDSTDAAAFFNLNIGENFLKLLTVTQELNKAADMNGLLKLITSKLVAYVKIDLAAIILWDEKKQVANIANATFPELPRYLIEKAVGKKVEEIVIDSEDEEQRQNLCIQCVLNNKLYIVDEMYPMVRPFLSKPAAFALQKATGMKHALLAPLVFENHKVGLLGLVWKDDSITPAEQLMVKIFADQVAVAVYKTLEYERLKKRVAQLEAKLKTSHS